MRFVIAAIAAYPRVVARRLVPTLAVMAIILGFANFLWFLADITRAGGGPDHASSPPPYLVNDHGEFSEVDRQTWEWLSFHERTLLITHPLALVGMGYLVRRLSTYALLDTADRSREGS